jgi:OOP family OmpA-OmpF porin
MKKNQLAIIALLASNTFLMAGGDFQEITPYEMEDIQKSEVEVKAIPSEVEVKAIPIVKTPIVVAPPPIVQKKNASVIGLYAGLGIVATRYDTNCGCRSKRAGIDKTAGVVGRVGYDFNQYVGVETRAMLTRLSDDGGKVKHLGLFVKPMYPVSKDINTYALVGIAKTTTQGKLRRTDVTGLAMGVGVEYDLSDDKKKDAKYNREFDGMADQEKGLGVFADYEKLYYKSSSPKLDALSVGVTYDF